MPPNRVRDPCHLNSVAVQADTGQGGSRATSREHQGLRMTMGQSKKDHDVDGDAIGDRRERKQLTDC